METQQRHRVEVQVIGVQEAVAAEAHLAEAALKTHTNRSQAQEASASTGVGGRMDLLAPPNSTEEECILLCTQSMTKCSGLTSTALDACKSKVFGNM